MQEQWISQNAYMRMYHIGYAEMKHLIDTKQVEVRETNGGHYKIKVGGDMVSKELYEEEKARRIKAENTLDNLRSVLKIN